MAAIFRLSVFNFCLLLVWRVAESAAPNIDAVPCPLEADRKYRYPWAQNVASGGAANMTCFDRCFEPFVYAAADQKNPNVTEVYWILPGAEMQHVKGGWSQPDQHRRTSGFGTVLYLDKVTSDNSGIYICALYGQVNGSSNWYYIRRGVNVYGPQMDSLLERYKWNFIIGSIASGTVLASVVFLCAIYKFRYRKDEEEEEDIRITRVPRKPLSYNGTGTFEDVQPDVGVEGVDNAGHTTSMTAF